ncbi:MAG: hypothetical protein Q4P71_07615 [Actinomycetaceae bacterium]|nr:hypothetical protein [Actinomycetaceae bacterium]
MNSLGTLLPVHGEVAAIWTACIATSMILGWGVTALILTIAKAPKPTITVERIPLLEARDSATREVMRGGTLIGLLERTIITTLAT